MKNPNAQKRSNLNALLRLAFTLFLGVISFAIMTAAEIPDWLMVGFRVVGVGGGLWLLVNAMIKARPPLEQRPANIENTRLLFVECQPILCKTAKHQPIR